MCHFSSQYWQQNWYLGQPISRAAVMLWDNWQLLTLNHSSSAAVAQRWQPRGVRCQQHKLELDFLFKQTYLLDWMPTWIYVHLFLFFFKLLCDFFSCLIFFWNSVSVLAKSHYSVRNSKFVDRVRSMSWRWATLLNYHQADSPWKYVYLHELCARESHNFKHKGNWRMRLCISCVCACRLCCWEMSSVRYPLS